MTFVIAGKKINEVNDFIKLLLILAPGSTIYKYGNWAEARSCVRSHKVDAVFVETYADSELGIIKELREGNPNLPVFVVAENDSDYEDAVWYEATGYLIKPVQQEALKKELINLEGKNDN